KHPTFRAVECGSGRYVVFVSAKRAGESSFTIWRMNASGGGLKQLSFGKSDHDPICSRDGEWVYYDDQSPGVRLMRVPLEGGAPSLVSDQIGIDDLSRDGRMAVYSKFIYDKKMVIVDTASGKQLHALEVKAEGHFPATFTPDGKAVVYPVRERGADNLWLQP